MIQKRKLKEEDFRGEKFKSFKNNLQGNNDILNLTNKQIIYEIHSEFLSAGADIIETNTFNSTKISQADYSCEDFSYDLNFAGGKIARQAADDCMANGSEKSLLPESLALQIEHVQCLPMLIIQVLEIFLLMNCKKIMKSQLMP